MALTHNFGYIYFLFAILWLDLDYNLLSCLMTPLKEFKTIAKRD